MVPRARLYPLILLHGVACFVLLGIVWATVDLALRANRDHHVRAMESVTATLAEVTEQHLLSALMDIDRTSLALRQAYLRDPGNFDRFLREVDVPQAIFPTFQVSVINAAGFLSYSSTQP
ncbi:hypothetical protein VZ95_18570, partial [Elstera litoralis]